MVSAGVGGNLNAIAQRGSRPTAPSRRCWAKRRHLDHDAVDVVAELGPALLPAVAGGQSLARGRRAARTSRVDPEAVPAQPASASQCDSSSRPVARADRVRPRAERPPGRDRRVLLAQRPGRRVARVHERLGTRPRPAPRSPARTPAAAGTPRRAPRPARQRPASRAARAGSSAPCAGWRSRPRRSRRRRASRRARSRPARRGARRPARRSWARSRAGRARRRAAARTRSTQAQNSSSLRAFASESIGWRCSTGANSARRRAADPLRRRVRRDQLGVLGLERRSSRISASYSASDDRRRVEHVVAVVGLVDQLPQLGRAASPLHHASASSGGSSSRSGRSARSTAAGNGAPERGRRAHARGPAGAHVVGRVAHVDGRARVGAEQRQRRAAPAPGRACAGRCPRRSRSRRTRPAGRAACRARPPGRIFDVTMPMPGAAAAQPGQHLGHARDRAAAGRRDGAVVLAVDADELVGAVGVELAHLLLAAASDPRHRSTSSGTGARAPCGSRAGTSPGSAPRNPPACRRSRTTMSPESPRRFVTESHRKSNLRVGGYNAT